MNFRAFRRTKRTRGHFLEAISRPVQTKLIILATIIETKARMHVHPRWGGEGSWIPRGTIPFTEPRSNSSPHLHKYRSEEPQQGSLSFPSPHARMHDNNAGDGIDIPCHGVRVRWCTSYQRSKYSCFSQLLQSI